MLYKTVGKMAELEVDVVTCQLDTNKQLLLCTDGLSGWNWERVSRAEVNAVMISSYDLQFACNRLISLAQERDMIDAVTAIIVGAAPLTTSARRITSVRLLMDTPFSNSAYN